MSPRPTDPQPLPPLREQLIDVLKIFAVGVVILFVLAIVGLVAFSRTDTGRKLFHSLGKAGRAVAHGFQGPEVEALHRLGCSTATVFRPEDTAHIWDDFADAGVTSAMGDATIVECVATGVQGSPSCEAVFGAYRAAGGAATDTVMVTVANSAGIQCSKQFEP